jgi:hypothetical protein
MYAQYQQYQTQNIQYQQPVVTSTPSSAAGGAQWNGKSWVYPTSNSNNNSTQPQQQQIVPPNPVQTFTQYYHGWTKREEELRNSIRAFGARNDHERQTVESNRQWAKYYAEESSRAAHHFHQYPQSTSAPFDLPPAPPTVTAIATATAGPSNNNGNNTTNNTFSSNSTATPSSSRNKNNSSSSTTTTTTTSNSSAGSITRYVKRNIERPELEKDPKLKAYVQSGIEKEIAAAIQKGTLQSKNWDLVPLIALPLDNANATATSKHVPPPPSPPEQKRYQQQQPYNGGNYYQNNSSVLTTNKSHYGNSSGSGSDTYYGPAASLPASSTSSKKFGGDKAQTSGAYYGPASSHNSTSVHNFQQIDSSKNNNNFFSSSPFVGKNKNSKRKHHYQQQEKEEDFIPFGIYGPSSSSSPGSSSSSGPKSSNTANKKAKKNHRKNKFVRESSTAIGTMHNDGMDLSRQTMSERANRFSGRGGIHEVNTANSRRGNNSEHDKYMGKGTIGGSKVTLDETDFEQMTVKGTSTTLEKGYLRLTAPPRPEFVRPFGILKQHLRNLQSEYYCCRIPEAAGDDRNTTTIPLDRMKTPQANWRILDCNDVHDGDKENSQIHRRQNDYLWFCSQLKAIRQDCTVQRILGDLAVDVYETHARIALQEGDLNEYNQCQTQLKELYNTPPGGGGGKGSVVLDDNIDNSSSVWKHQEEFIAYRLLYYVFLSTNEKYSGGSSDMFHIMLSMTSKERNQPAIRHALKVREAIASSDYFKFFRLHKSSPNLGVFLTNLLVPTMRMRGLRRIAKAYRPSVELSVCLQYLGFGDSDSEVQSNSKEAGDETKIDERSSNSGKINEEGKSWLISCGGVIEGSKFVTKDSEIHAPNTENAKNSLI